MQTRIIVFSFIIAVMLPVCFNTWGLTESSEARYAEISREMYLSGDYVHPKLLGISHYHKPPLTYYITALGYGIFGVNEYGARFFPALALLLQLLLVFKIANALMNDKKTAFIATLFYFSYPIVHAASVNLTTDCFLTTFIFATIYFYLKHRREKGYPYNYLFYFFCALCFLTKGPVGVLPPAVFAITNNLVLKTRKKKFGFHHLLAVLMCLLICGSWFLALLINDPSLLDYFVNHQLVDRVASTSFGRSQPFWYYLLFMPLAGLPVFIVFIDYLITGAKKDWKGRSVNLIPGISFLVCFIVFSASSSKLIFYVLPLYLFTAILSARHLLAMSEQKQKVYGNIFFYFSLVLTAAFIFAGYLLPDFVIPVLPVGIACVACIVLLVLLKYQKVISLQVSMLLVPAACIALLTFILPGVMKKNELAINSAKPLAAFINSQPANDSAGIVVYDQLLPSLEFYTNKKIITIHNANSKSVRETQFEANKTATEKRYFDVSNDWQSKPFHDLAGQPNYYVVVKTDRMVPDSLSFLINKLTHKTVIGKWIIYH